MTILVIGVLVLGLTQYSRIMDFFRFNHIIYLKNLGKYDKAIEEYQAHFFGNHLSASKLRNLVDLYVLAQRYPTALNFALELTRRDNLKPDYHYTLGILYHQTHNFSSAYKTMQNYISLVDNLNIQVKPEEYDLASAYVAWYEQRWTDIIRVLGESRFLKEQEIQTREWSKLPYQSTIISLSNTLLGAALFNMERYIQSQHILSYALNFNYSEALTHFYLGMTYCCLDDFNRGEYHLSISRSLFPEIIRFTEETLSPILLSSTHDIRITRMIKPIIFLKDYEHADFLLDLITTDSFNAGDYYALKGEIKERLGMKEDAQRYYLSALDYAPYNVTVRYRLALLDGRGLQCPYLRSILHHTLELENLSLEGKHGTIAEGVALAHPEDFISLDSSALFRHKRTPQFLNVGLVGKSMLRSKIGGLLGVYVNDALVNYLYLPETEWKLHPFRIRCQSPSDKIKVVFLNNYIAGIDNPNLREDRNVYLDRILVFQSP